MEKSLCRHVVSCYLHHENTTIIFSSLNMKQNEASNILLISSSLGNPQAVIVVVMMGRVAMKLGEALIVMVVMGRAMIVVVLLGIVVQLKVMRN